MNTTSYEGTSFPMWEISGFGMSLRDYFAAMAMHGFITNIDTRRSNLINVPQLAKSSYNVADAMLKARETSND